MTRAPEPILRKWPKGLLGLAFKLGMPLLPLVFAFFRWFAPNPKIFKFRLVTRFDDVREALMSDHAFMVPYAKNLNVITGGQPCFVGMADSPEYRHDLARLRSITLPQDLPELAARSEAEAEAIVAASGGKLEVVDQLFRTVTFSVLKKYIGIPDPPDSDLRVWSTRLFEYQFVTQDKEITAQVEQIAPALWAHIDAEIVRRRSEGAKGEDLLARALRMQAQDSANWPDLWIRTALLALIVGGPPQPPMVLPRALNQLLNRPEALSAAQTAAHHPASVPNLLAYVLEGMRFDPISPFLPRTAIQEFILAEGTSRAITIPRDADLKVSIQSAMMDGRRIPEPRRFDASRQPHQYLHFGFQLHRCFGEHINHAMFPAIMAPLLRRRNLRRAAGGAGRLTNIGIFPASMTVEFDKDG